MTAQRNTTTKERATCSPSRTSNTKRGNKAGATLTCKLMPKPHLCPE
ncbi:unnamed protein product [Phaeothamnion confervicola]